MNSIDAEEMILSERDSVLQDDGESGSQTTAGREVVGSLKLVPVAESIRYRKRAQSAEKKTEILAEQLAEAQAKVNVMTEQLSKVQLEREMMWKLSAAGVIDLETAVLVAKAKIEEDGESDFDGVIEQLRKEKRYLFGSNSVVVTSKKTAGVKGRVQNSQSLLERAAKRASTTGNRADLQEYLKLRRNFV